MTDKQSLLRDIERQRADLSETVDALSAKFDVKARATAGTKTLLTNAKETIQTKPAEGIDAVKAAVLTFVEKVRRG